MTAGDPEVEHPGDPRHPEHERYLLALGRATFQAALMAGVCYDILRVWADVDAAEMDREPLGTLERRLRAVGDLTAEEEGELGSLPRFEEFMTALKLARELRNDLFHALPALHGLVRRGSKVIVTEGNAWTFFTCERVETLTETFELVTRLGNAVLYSDDGDRVARWASNVDGARP